MKRKHPDFVLAAVVCALMTSLLFSCAGKPDAKTTVRSESTVRSYERFLKDHSAASEEDLNRAGIHYRGRNIYVVISLTDTGADRYPEWAADKLLTSLYGYRAVDQRKVSDDEFFELVLKFSLEKIVEGKYENLARVIIDERDVDTFVRLHLKDF